MPEESSPTKKQAPKQTLAEKVTELEATTERLESAFSRLAVMTGQGNMLREYGIERWMPEKKHMKKYG